MDTKTAIDWKERLLVLASDRPLGARVEENATHFSIFAPRATRVTVSFFRYLDSPEPRTLELTRHDDGTWSGNHPQNLHGWYYYYHVESTSEDPPAHFEPEFKILDPYAVATVSPDGPGIIWDSARIAPVKAPFEPPAPQDLVIVEAHVRDLIRKAAVAIDEDERLGFTGLRKWLKAEDNYLKSLGVNAVELQPVQEFGDAYEKRAYHWGYMTVNYFAPESSYALQPQLATQIEELQKLVRAFHEEGLAVILDVVYNHAGLPNHLLHIDKYYYFNVDPEGNLTNHSGCGNDLRCEAPMTRRLIIDSLVHLVRTYDVDGFRFDLAELIGMDVLQDIESALRAVKPSIILIAEPWSFRGHIALQLKDTGYSSWNDGYREFIRDYLMGHGNHEGLWYFMRGSIDHLTNVPGHSVNYVESHDDHCWIDKITENHNHHGDNPTRNDRRRTHLLCGILMSSLGIPMIAAGQDTLRSKQGIHNTYREAEINAINYHRLLSFSGSHEYFRNWIRFRLSPLGRIMRPADRPTESYMQMFTPEQGSAAAILFNADWSNGPQRLIFAVNPHHETAYVSLNGIELRNWTQLADHERFDERGLSCARFPFRNGNLELPPLTCGLWRDSPAEF